jgi:hypothetical protein
MKRKMRREKRIPVFIGRITHLNVNEELVLTWSDCGMLCDDEWMLRDGGR